MSPTDEQDFADERDLTEEEDPDEPPHDVRDRMDAVAQCFVNGMTIPAIVEYLEREENIKVARDVPYQDLARATARRWIRYEPPPDEAMGRALREKYRGLRNAVVPKFGRRRAVMISGARLCAGAIQKIAETKALGSVTGVPKLKIPPSEFLVKVPIPGDEHGRFEMVPFADLDLKKDDERTMEPKPLEVVIRVGFSGGYTMSLTARELRKALSEQVEDWERDLKEQVLKEAVKRDVPAPQKGLLKRRFRVEIRFVFINLVSGFDLEPRTNPIAFLTEFTRDQRLVSRTTVKLFNAMPFVEVGRQNEFIKKLKPLKKVRQDYDDFKLDVILTSGSSIDDPHGLFSRYYDSENLPGLLESEGVEGDVLWMPITKKAPLAMKELSDKWKAQGRKDDVELIKFKPMTLLSMEDVQKHVAPDKATGHQGADVFLILAPCSKCLREKSRIAMAALGQDKQIVTHFVADRQTAAVILGKEDPDED